ncbi:hypothetical protein JTB14_005080 [Gonioctena quinquepunctata]|nr:hypothetical protein JTB14_005080 [Gonioctena quinquepunctata]
MKEEYGLLARNSTGSLLTGQYADNCEAAFANVSFFTFSVLACLLICNVWKLYSIAFPMLIAVGASAWLEVRIEHIRKMKNITRF